MWHISGMFCESSNAGLIIEETSSVSKEDSVEGFPIEKTIKTKILGLVCAMRSFENIDKDNIDEWMQIPLM